MLALGIVLSVVLGLVLGLLGGGGSILTVPILVYAFGLEAKAAIATSLLVVGLTSAAAAVRHGRDGNVELRTGLVFGAVAMAGAYGGGRLAVFVPGSVLLLVFATTMLAAGIAMLRPRRSAAAGQAGERGWIMLVAQALALGAFTGLVGAGGGFLIVPVLVLGQGLSMPAAIGTSLLVIAMNSAAGFAGYLAHVTIDLRLAAFVTVAAIAGAFVGVLLVERLSADALRRLFAWFVLAMAGFMFVEETPTAVTTSPFTAALAGGVLIGLGAATLLVLNGRIAGISGIVDGLLHPRSPDMPWRAAFVAGLVGTSAVLAAIRPDAFAIDITRSPVTFALAGLLVGVGTRLGSGCTSGHGVCGIGRGSVRSLVATLTFMLTGGLTVFVVGHALGGMR